MNWLIKKEKVLSELKSKGITNKEFIRKYVNLERRVNTCQNMLYNRNYSWEAMCYSKAYSQADDIIMDLKEKHIDDWQKLTGTNSKDIYAHPNLGDFLS